MTKFYLVENINQRFSKLYLMALLIPYFRAKIIISFSVLWEYFMHKWLRHLNTDCQAASAKAHLMFLYWTEFFGLPRLRVSSLSIWMSLVSILLKAKRFKDNVNKPSSIWKCFFFAMPKSDHAKYTCEILIMRTKTGRSKKSLAKVNNSIIYVKLTVMAGQPKTELLIDFRLQRNAHDTFCIS